MIQGVPKKLGGFIWAPFVAFNDQNRFSHRFFTFLKQPGNELERSHCHLKSQKYIEDTLYIYLCMWFCIEDIFLYPAERVGV